MRLYYSPMCFEPAADKVPERANLTLRLDANGRVTMQASTHDYAMLTFLLDIARSNLSGNVSYEFNEVEAQLGSSEKPEGREV